MLTYVEPWRTRLASLDLPDLNDSALLGELFSAVNLQRNGLRETDMCCAETTPGLYRVREEIVTPAILAYLWECYGYRPENLESTAWVVYGESNPGLELHSHAEAQISSVLHLVANPGDLILLDPRNHACRGYPQEIRQTYFANHRITPVNKRLHIFPSYVQHYVEAGPGEFRVAIAFDYFF